MQLCAHSRAAASQLCRSPVGTRRPALRTCAVGGGVFRRRITRCQADNKDNGGASSSSSNKKDKQTEYVEALIKGGIDQKTAKQVLDKWKEAGVDVDPNQLRKLFLKQSLAPITASAIQLLFDGAAAYSIFISAGFFAIGPSFFGRTVLVFLLDFLAVYFAFGVFFDIVTLTSVIITTARLGTTPLAFYDAIKSIASPSGSSGGLAVIQKAKEAVSSVKVAQALDAIAAMLDASAGGKGSGGTGKATKSVDTLTNLSAYLTLYRAEAQGGFDPSSVGMSEQEAANIALAFGRYDLDDNGRLDSKEFVLMLQSLGTEVSQAEADAAMEAMDTNKDGFISFDEFARWWCGRSKKVATAGVKA